LKNHKQITKIKNNQRYFTLVAYSSYVHTVLEPSKCKITMTFSEWKNQRPEIQSMHSKLTKRVNISTLFRPIQDLSIISLKEHTKSHTEQEYDNFVRQVFFDFFFFLFLFFFQKIE